MNDYNLNEEDDISFEEVKCCVCNCGFGIETQHLEHLMKSHRSFYCPNGHCQSFKKTEEEKSLEEQIAKEKALHDQTKEELANIKGKRKDNFLSKIGIKF